MNWIFQKKVTYFGFLWSYLKNCRKINKTIMAIRCLNFIFKFYLCWELKDLFIILMARFSKLSKFRNFQNNNFFLVWFLIKRMAKESTLNFRAVPLLEFSKMFSSSYLDIAAKLQDEFFSFWETSKFYINVVKIGLTVFLLY